MANALTPAQIAAYAANAGFSGDALNVATAIALAESSGNPYVVGDTNISPGGSVGLWQINLAAHPEYEAGSLLDPQANANAAYAVYQQSGGQFTPWTTFNTGAYTAYLPTTSLAVPDDGSDLPDAGSTSPSSFWVIAAVAGMVGLAWWID
jgi:soluble lytic murein transglycosylase-like protein